MKLKHQELEIKEESPFANCKLNRSQYAFVLTEIVNTYSDGFVLAINNEWGTGKTTFVKMWQQYLKNEGFQTVYFNAWENDFDSNPLVALMSELKILTNSENEELFKSVVEKGALLTKNVVPAIAKALIKKYIGDVSDIVADTVENTAKTAAEILEKEIKEYSTKKKTIIEFRNGLEKFVKRNHSDRPLILIIDELDRCRPTYAVEVLEQVKHFFSVPGIVCVLSIDKNHMASCVKGFYGSEHINTDEYLRRFIDLEYSIPPPSTEVFCKYLFEYFSFNDFFFSQNRVQYAEFKNDANSFLNMAEILFNKTSATLRQQEKIFGQARLILNSFQSNQYTFSHLLFVLIFIKVMKSELYRKIENNLITIQELSDAFADLILFDTQKPNDLNLVYIEALLLHFYNNNQGHQGKWKLFEKKQEGDFVSPIISKLDDGNGRTSLARCFSFISDQWNYSETNLNYLLRKINLTESILIR